MANGLTGDFDAVVQVAGSTVNRLVASMHQNDGRDDARPTVPHLVRIRIGDDHPIDGVVGWLAAQIGVPRITLLHGSNDRFHMDVGVRATFDGDVGSTPFPRYVHGTVRADYRLEEIPSSCAGWSKLADEYLWIRVVRDSVRFDGDWDDADGGLVPAFAVVPTSDPDTTRELIRRQIVALLDDRFEATPHPVSARFRRGHLRSIVGHGTSAVTFGMHGDGDIASVGNIFLDGADVAAAYAVEPLMAEVDRVLDSLRSIAPIVPVVATPFIGPSVSTVYRGRITSLSAEWIPAGSSATVKVLAHGDARTDSILADATFAIHQEIHVDFDGGEEAIRLSPGSGNVTVSSSGIGHIRVRDEVHKAVAAMVADAVEGACRSIQPSLDAMVASKDGLVKQVQTLDARGDVWLERAQFLQEGVVLLGRVVLSARRRPVVEFAPDASRNGHVAITSWIPGGRIDTFEWRWEAVPGGAGGPIFDHARFVFRRPLPMPGKFGLVASAPLPGLDGSGRVCLVLRGVVVDPVTGSLRRIETKATCHRYGLWFLERPGSRLSLYEEPELSRDVPVPELRVRAAATLVPAPTNLLVVNVREELDERTRATLDGALRRCRREGTGLTVLVLFARGELAGDRGRAADVADELSREHGAAVTVNEDVAGEWADEFALRPEPVAPSWRLLSPGGGVVWMHDGTIDDGTLAQVLERGLVTAPPSRVDSLAPAVVAGSPVIGAFRRDVVDPDDAERDCPAPPIGRLAREAIVGFVRQDTDVSHPALAGMLERPPGGEEPLVFIVVDGDDGTAARALADRTGGAVEPMPDAAGTIADRFGIRTWPSVVHVDRSGIVMSIDDLPGFDELDTDALEPVEDEEPPR